MADMIVALVAFSANAVLPDVLINSSFEQPLSTEWVCDGCTGRVVSDAHSGNSSFMATERTATWQGALLVLQPSSGASTGRIYQFTGYVKVLPTLPDQGPQNLYVMLVYVNRDGSLDIVDVTKALNIQPEDDWVLMEAEFYILELNQTELSLTIQGADARVDFLVDTLSIVHVGSTDLEYGILNNPGFEKPLGGSGWYCYQCELTLVTDSHTGSKAIKAFDRGNSWRGIAQDLSLGLGTTAGQIYQFTGYVKVLPSLPRQRHQRLYASLYYEHTGWLIDIVVVNSIAPSDGWVRLEAEFYTRDVSQDQITLTIAGPEAGVDYLVDSLSIEVVGQASMESANQVLRNPGFENPIGGSGWYCYGGCNETRVDDSHTGSKSYKAFGRQYHGQGPAQELEVGSEISSDSVYQFAGYVKILESSSHQQIIKAAMGYNQPDGSEQWFDIVAARVSPADGWVQMAAEFRTPNVTSGIFLFSIEGPDPGVDFLIDTLSLASGGQA